MRPSIACCTSWSNLSAFLFFHSYILHLKSIMHLFPILLQCPPSTNHPLSYIIVRFLNYLYALAIYTFMSIFRSHTIMILNSLPDTRCSSVQQLYQSVHGPQTLTSQRQYSRSQQKVIQKCLRKLGYVHTRQQAVTEEFLIWFVSVLLQFLFQLLCLAMSNLNRTNCSRISFS